MIPPGEGCQKGFPRDFAAGTAKSGSLFGGVGSKGHLTAIASISTSASFGSLATSTALRAGGSLGKKDA